MAQISVVRLMSGGRGEGYRAARGNAMRDGSFTGTGSDSSADDFPIVVTAMASDARQRKIAFLGFLISFVLVAAALPIANVPLVRVAAFTPVVQTVMCLADLLTAALLFSQYAVQPHRALLVLAAGFVFAGLFAFLQTLSFPNAYVPGALIGDELNSAGWLFVCWHTTFPLAVIVYALIKDEHEAPRRQNPLRIVSLTVACVVAATAALTWFAATGAEYLPSLYRDTIDQTGFAFAANVALTLLSAAAIMLVLVRGKTILDQWLIVTLLAWAPNFVVAVLFTVVRFTLGWYLGRVYALLAGSSLLVVLLAEALYLHARLANAVVLLRRSEQHQRLLIAELDHRVKNILAQVAAVVGSTRQASSSVDGFGRAIDGRIQSMAAAHTLLSRSRWQNVSLDSLVRAELAPYATGRNVKISGEDVPLSPAETEALAKVLHELATNAAKYGALSVPNGQAAVSWKSAPNGHAATLSLEWRELGGPRVASKVQSSYGTSLIRELIPYELGGNVDLEFQPIGLRCRIEFPLERASAGR